MRGINMWGGTTLSGFKWKYFLKHKCELIKKGKKLIWYSHANVHYFVNKKTKEILIFHGCHGENYFNEIEGEGEINENCKD